MNVTTTTDKKNKQIIVNATVNPDVTKKDTANTALVMEFLNNNNIKVGECIEEGYACNRNGIIASKWVFLMPNEKRIVDKPTPPMIDSNSEVTSIPEEETQAAGPAAKRRRRKTTTKKEG